MGTVHGYKLKALKAQALGAFFVLQTCDCGPPLASIPRCRQVAGAAGGPAVPR